MPQGQLYIRTQKVAVSQTDDCRANRGIVTDTESPFFGYADAYVRYGLSLEEGAVDKLLTPAPHKQPVGSGNALTPGMSYIGGSVGVTDERNISLNVHVVADSYKEHLIKWKLFCEEIIGHAVGDVIRVKTVYFPDTVYRLVYQACEQLSGFSQGMTLFTLSFLEPHPELRTDNI